MEEHRPARRPDQAAVGPHPLPRRVLRVHSTLRRMLVACHCEESATRQSPRAVSRESRQARQRLLPLADEGMAAHRVCAGALATTENESLPQNLNLDPVLRHVCTNHHALLEWIMDSPFSLVLSLTATAHEVAPIHAAAAPGGPGSTRSTRCRAKDGRSAMRWARRP